jgi:phosphoesterase RecJ-like protein
MAPTPQPEPSAGQADLLSAATSATLSEIAGVLNRARRVLAFCHVNPDGDALGSLLALGWLLRTLPSAGAENRLRRETAHAATDAGCATPESPDTNGACRTVLVCADPVPAKLAFLPGAGQITRKPPRGPWDAVVVLDSSDPKRVGDPFHRAAYRAAPIIVLDHHVTNLHFGTLNYVDPGAASTSEIVVDLAGALGVTIGPEAATCLLTGLVTDTLGFRTSNVTLKVLNTASRLMERGADLHRITELTLGNRPLSIMRLWGLALSQLHLDEGILWAEVTREMRELAGVPDEDDGGLVSHLITAHEARVAAVFGELNDGTVDVDLRATLPYEVASVALRLGGGGHPQASGCHLPGPLAAAVGCVLPLLMEAAHVGTLAR